ncbi:MAG: S49 family peptidase [Pseudomonadota bacterium]|nr:S49 family peptidase [Pseudomonadota bacterium]
MPGWSETIKRIAEGENPHSALRKQLIRLSDKRGGRNVIVYSSGFMQKDGMKGTEIDSNDKHAFMAIIHGLKRRAGLDLLLHTPGGDAFATNSLIYYMREMFGGDVEVFVPQMAMSGGTIIACASTMIHMGKPSNLGPIDPQMPTPWGMQPATGIMSGWKRAKKSLEEGASDAALWVNIVAKYPLDTIIACENAINWSVSTVKDLLATGMFKNEAGSAAKIDKIVEGLSMPEHTVGHARQLTLKEVKDLGLKVKELEKDQELQDLVMDIHHICMYIFGATPSLKIVANHLGNALERHQVQYPIPKQV